MPYQEVVFSPSAERYRGQGIELSIRTGEVAGVFSIIDDGDLVAVKMTPGEWGNLHTLRPQEIRVIIDEIKARGGSPFIVDCTTIPIYTHSSRVRAKLYLETFRRHGFTQETMGCPIVIGDAMLPTMTDEEMAQSLNKHDLGTLEVEVSTGGGQVLETQFVGKAFEVADSMIVVSHVKGHDLALLGGALKNVGVGCASKRGKHQMHHASVVAGHKITVDHSKCPGKACDFAEDCEGGCPVGAITLDDTIHIDYDKCSGWECFVCLTTCNMAQRGEPALGLTKGWIDVTGRAMVDSAASILKSTRAGKNGKIGYIHIIKDIAKMCDCNPNPRGAIVGDIGVAASLDMLAVDMFSLHAIESQCEKAGVPGLRATWPTASECFGAAEGLDGYMDYAERRGLGSLKYTIADIEKTRDPRDPLWTQDGRINANFIHRFTIAEKPTTVGTMPFLKKTET